MASYTDLARLRDIHKGVAAVVLGGGPSLLADLDTLPDGIWIGVNQHTMLLALDYIVYHDGIIGELVADHRAKKITHLKHHCEAGGDEFIWSGIVPQFNFTGGQAVWIAEWFGCDPILISGMDAYSSTRDYWHSLPGIKKLGRAASLFTPTPWIKVRDHMRAPEKVRVLSGPLMEVFNNG